MAANKDIVIPPLLRLYGRGKAQQLVWCCHGCIVYVREQVLLAGLVWYLTGQIIKLCFERKRRRQARNEVVAQKEHCRQELGGVALFVASNIELTGTLLPPSSFCIPVRLFLGKQDESTE